MVPRRRRNRPAEPVADEGVEVRELADRHLLLVPTTTKPGLVSDLVRDRIPESDLATIGEVALGRHSRLSGPFQLSMEDAVDAAVPMPWTVCYYLEAPVEREDPPIPGVDDRDGFASAFPDGLPWREEGRALHLMVSLARRVSGAVRVAGSLQVIMPDPDRAVDHIVHAPVWLDPEVLLAVIGRELPNARLALEGLDWPGPSDAAYSGELIAPALEYDPLTTDDLHELHAAADRVDMDTMAGADVVDAFAVIGDQGQDGAVEVLVHLSDGEEPAVVTEPWGDRDFVTYEVRWANPDPEDRERRHPPEAFLAARARMAPVVLAVTRAVVEATSGVVLDEDGFRVDRYAL